MASKEAEEYVENLIADYSDYHKFDDELTALTSVYWENIPVKLDDVLEAFDAGVESERKKHEWHNPEELPIQQDENEVKRLFLIKYTFNHSDRVHVGCSYFNFDLHHYVFPVAFHLQDTCKLISWKEVE